MLLPAIYEFNARRGLISKAAHNLTAGSHVRTASTADDKPRKVSHLPRRKKVSRRSVASLESVLAPTSLRHLVRLTGYAAGNILLLRFPSKTGITNSVP